MLLSSHVGMHDWLTLLSYMLQMRACRLVDTDASAYLMRLDAGKTITEQEHREAWNKTRESVRHVLRAYGDQFFQEPIAPSHSSPAAGSSHHEQYQGPGLLWLFFVLPRNLRTHLSWFLTLLLFSVWNFIHGWMVAPTAHGWIVPASPHGCMVTAGGGWMVAAATDECMAPHGPTTAITRR